MKLHTISTVVGRHAPVVQSTECCWRIITAHLQQNLLIAIAFMQRWRGGIQTIQSRTQRCRPACRVGEQMLIETAIVVPLPPLAKLAPMKSNFLLG